MDKEIEQMVNSYSKIFVRDNPKMKHIKWESELRWERIHIDYGGSFEGKYFIVMVDTDTKWLGVQVLPNTDSKSTIRVLRRIFATFRLPVQSLCKNVTSFISCEFPEILKSNGIKRTLIPPYHLSSNGQVERYVQTAKICLKN